MNRDEAIELMRGGVQGVEEWNRRRTCEPIPDLTGVDLHGAVLTQADLSGVNLERANLTRAGLVHANLSRARLYRTNLSRADLARTIFRDAVLHSACLHGSVFQWSELEGADFCGAQFGATILSGVNLSAARGLESAVHFGPSMIGLDTVSRSGGRIPTVFLQGCGVPDVFLSNIPTLMNTQDPIRFYSCFISYNSNDELFARRLYADLQARGVRCWFAPENLRIGEKIRVRIDESIQAYDKLLLVLSEHSLKSSWVEKEVETAIEKEHMQARTMLFPVRTDDAVMRMDTGWPADIHRSRHIGDFRNWKNRSAYQRAFDRLMRDLTQGGANEIEGEPEETPRLTLASRPMSARVT